MYTYIVKNNKREVFQTLDYQYADKVFIFVNDVCDLEVEFIPTFKVKGIYLLTHYSGYDYDKYYMYKLDIATKGQNSSYNADFFINAPNSTYGKVKGIFIDKVDNGYGLSLNNFTYEVLDSEGNEVTSFASHTTYTVRVYYGQTELASYNVCFANN